MRNIIAAQLTVGDLYYDTKWSERCQTWVANQNSRHRVADLVRCGNISGNMHVNGTMCYDQQAPLIRVN